MTAVTYTSTEKKRIRKSFAKRQAVLNVPFLLSTQLESYTAFLQAAVPAQHRKPRSARFSRSRAIRVTPSSISSASRWASRPST